MIFFLQKTMSGITNSEILSRIESIYETLVESGFNLNTMEYEDIKREFIKNYNQSYEEHVPPPRLISAIRQTIDKYKKPTDVTPETPTKTDNEKLISELVNSSVPRRGPKTRIISDIIAEDRQRQFDLTRSSIQNTDHAEFCTSVIDNMNVIVKDNKYPIDKNIKPFTDFPPQYDALDEAEYELVEHVLGDNTMNEYSEIKNRYISELSKLRQQYALGSGNKSKVTKEQKFTYKKEKSEDSKGRGKSKKNDANDNITYTKSVKCIDPKDTKKTLTLPENEAKVFIDYNDYMESFAKKWSEALSHKEFDYLKYLTLNTIRTQNIIKFDKLHKILAVKPEYVCSTINSVLYHNNGDFLNIDDEQLHKLIDSGFGPEYAVLFNDIKDLQYTRFDKVIKTIYLHRRGVVLHEKCNEIFKKEHWLQALANIASLDVSTYNEHEQSVINAWKNVLSSKFAYYIIMHCIPESDLFNKSIINLIQDSVSIKLMESALYPISFVFTPFMMGRSSLSLPKDNVGMSLTKYKELVKNTFNSFGSLDTKSFEYDACAWLYYAFERNITTNVMINIVHTLVKNIDVKAKSKNDEDETELENMANI